MSNLLTAIAKLLKGILWRTWESRALLEEQSDLMRQIRDAVLRIEEKMPGKP